ncbi:hypothetical protein GJAV_G00114970 [Gymnothorax javanicus]|nr:hypothetical protein GJAV_G00114970 [Gymnothorax javanicus]
MVTDVRQTERSPSDNGDGRSTGDFCQYAWRFTLPLGGTLSLCSRKQPEETGMNLLSKTILEGTYSSRDEASHLPKWKGMHCLNQQSEDFCLDNFVN